MEETVKNQPGRTSYTVAGWALMPSALLGWIAGWIFYLGPTLINDEYAAIDYFYRIVRDGELYATPHRLHKPLSILFGFFSWLTESPIGFEMLTAVFAVAFIILLYLAMKRALGKPAAIIIAAAVAVSPDLMYYSATGSTIMPFCALSFAGLYAWMRREEGELWLWVYALSFLVAGLLRPESWLFAGPILIWWWPGKDKKKWMKVIVAGSIIMLGPVIWFGKDYFLNGNLMHGIEVSARAKEIGTGAPLGPLYITKLFWMRVSSKVGIPLTLAGVAGLILFIFRDRFKAVIHPFTVYPAIVSFYVWMIVYMGVYPVQRYWYFDAVFAVVFAVFLGKALYERTEYSGFETARAGVFHLALAPILILLLSGAVESHPLAFAALMAAGGAALLIDRKFYLEKPASFALTGVLVFIGVSYLIFLVGFYRLEVSELRLEGQIQTEMVEAASFLDEEIPRGADERILIPSRRNEQLNWLWRHREIPEIFTFREAFYLDYFRKIDFLELHPDWIVYIDRDYQFWGPEKLFRWLQFQDRTVLGGITIELVNETDNIRIFKVAYPKDHPPKAPLPKIP